MKKDSNILRVSFPVKHTEEILFNVLIYHCSLTEKIQQQIRQVNYNCFHNRNFWLLTACTFTITMPDNCHGKTRKWSFNFIQVEKL